MKHVLVIVAGLVVRCAGLYPVSPPSQQLYRTNCGWPWGMCQPQPFTQPNNCCGAQPRAPCPTACPPAAQPAPCPTTCPPAAQPAPCPTACPPAAQPAPCPTTCPTATLPPGPCPVICPTAVPPVKCPLPCQSPWTCGHNCLLQQTTTVRPSPTISTQSTQLQYETTQRAVCPHGGQGCRHAASGYRRRRSTQRRCALDAQCPLDSSCCETGCGAGKTCRRSIMASLPPSAPYPPTLTLHGFTEGQQLVNNGPPYWETPSPLQQLHKVNVSVIFTSACSSSSWFINYQLFPAMSTLRQHVHLELIPYGLVRQDGGCQYGYGDCLGNWLVSCGGRHLTGGESAQLAFAACLTQHTHILRQATYLHQVFTVAQKCVLESGGGRSGSEAGLQAVYQCALSGEGSQLFLEAGRRQHQLAPALLQVPVVAIDDVVVVEKKADLDTFSELLCRHLQHRILTPQARVFCRQVTARPPASSALTVG